MATKLTRSNLAGWLMALPGVLLIATFIILPFFLAFAFSLTNQRLASPNPTEYVGFENYSDLLGLAVFTLEPERDDAGTVVRDRDGKRQRLGHAVSTDLHSWHRVGTGLILDIDPRYEEYEEGRWHDRAFRDPWVMRDPEGSGWLMVFTARKAGVDGWLDAGAIGFATSPDLNIWTHQDPIFVGGFGELEVPQVFQKDGHWYCLFCTAERFWTDEAKTIIGGTPMTGSHYLMADSPRGPWRIAPGPMLDGAIPVTRYAARIVDTKTGLKLLGFRWFDPQTGDFVGAIDDPVSIQVEPDGRLTTVVQR